MCTARMPGWKAQVRPRSRGGGCARRFYWPVCKCVCGSFFLCFVLMFVLSCSFGFAPFSVLCAWASAPRLHPTPTAVPVSAVGSGAFSRPWQCALALKALCLCPALRVALALALLCLWLWRKTAISKFIGLRCSATSHPRTPLPSTALRTAPRHLGASAPVHTMTRRRTRERAEPPLSDSTTAR